MIFNKHLPDYYPTMYMDGYSPYEIIEAHRNIMRKGIQDQKKEKAITEKMWQDLISKQLETEIESAINKIFNKK